MNLCYQSSYQLNHQFWQLEKNDHLFTAGSGEIVVARETDYFENLLAKEISVANMENIFEWVIIVDNYDHHSFPLVRLKIDNTLNHLSKSYYSSGIQYSRHKFSVNYKYLQSSWGRLRKNQPILYQVCRESIGIWNHDWNAMSTINSTIVFKIQQSIGHLVKT